MSWALGIYSPAKPQSMAFPHCLRRLAPLLTPLVQLGRQTWLRPHLTNKKLSLEEEAYAPTIITQGTCGPLLSQNKTQNPFPHLIPRHRDSRARCLRSYAKEMSNGVRKLVSFSGAGRFAEKTRVNTGGCRHTMPGLMDCLQQLMRTALNAVLCVSALCH